MLINIIIGIAIAFLIFVIVMSVRGYRRARTVLGAAPEPSGQAPVVPGPIGQIVVYGLEEGEAVPPEVMERVYDVARRVIGERYRHQLASELEIPVESLSMEHMFKKFAEGIAPEDVQRAGFLAELLTEKEES